MKPVCANCQLFFQVEKNGFYFEEGMPTESGYQSYKLWVGDLWKCRGCGAQIVVGVSQGSIAEHYHPDYSEKLQQFNPNFRVDDC